MVVAAARVLVALAVLGTAVVGTTGTVVAEGGNDELEGTDALPSVPGEYGGGETDSTDEFADLTGLERSDSAESEHVSYGTSGASSLLR